MTDPKTTPMMLQWEACKKAAGDALLLFRLGDFYEAFHDDAILIAQELELTLTKRQEIPMCGVPHYTCEIYIDKLVSKGYRVAIAEQTEDPKLTKGIVKREVVRVVTPGTLISSALLSEKSHNFIASLAKVGKLYGIAFLDLTTAAFTVTELHNENELLNELSKMEPTELIIGSKFYEKNGRLIAEIKQSLPVVITTHDEWRFEHKSALEFLLNHFRTKSLEGFGLHSTLTGINAAGALLSYIQDSLNLSISHIRAITPYSTTAFMQIDRATQKHLEITQPLYAENKQHTLLALLDRTETPMGGRLLKQWVCQPLIEVSAIEQRQDAIEELLSAPARQEILKEVRDLERLMMRVVSGYASPRDLIALKRSLAPLHEIKSSLQNFRSRLIQEAELTLESFPELVELIERAVNEDAPAKVSDGGTFKRGYSAELDELCSLSQDSKEWLARYQIDLKEKTQIKTLKVGFNRMFGYYVEVSKGQAEKMPDIFMRRQTLVNAERFITPELKTFESKMMHAEERITAIESELFHHLRQQIALWEERVLRSAKVVAFIDVLISLAAVARENHYVRPIVDSSTTLEILEGRHPIIEKATAAERFVPNDTLLNDTTHKLLLITGPNMAGKSTYLRQVALIAILAHIGSFVPAKAAKIGIVDKVFSRIGASDNLARGQSTFMVEMTETANILNNATSRSLVILDEIGRGTSTYDGISIAWAVAEYLLTAEEQAAKTLFATHYCELTKLEEKVPGAVNYHIAVHESGDNILFLRKIVRGGTDKSYGIHVGRLAGLPHEVINRAQEILLHLEENANRKSTFEPTVPRKPPSKTKPHQTEQFQLTFFN